MDRRFQQAIDEDFERLVRESPRPMLMNGELAGDPDIFERHEQQRIIRPVPIALVRNRAAPAFVSPLAKTLDSPHPRYSNTANNHDVSNVNESIEEIFDYLKQKSFDSSGENLERNSSNVYENDQSKSFKLSKNVSVGNVSDNYIDDIETIDTSFSAHGVMPGHKHHFVYRNDRDKDVSSTVYNSHDELDTYDTGYGTSNLKDLSLSGDEQVLNERTADNVTNIRSDLHEIHGDGGDDVDREDDFSAAHNENDAGSNLKQNGYSYEIECREIGDDDKQSSVEENDVGRDQELCSLYMWIIKPIPATQFICVEGKKHPDEDDFWKSGIITKRLNSMTILTQSGSIYKLEGDIEVADAIYAGFSRETVAAFKNGFPEDWKDLIDDHFNNSLQERPYISEVEISTSTVKEPVVSVKESSCQSKEKEYVLSEWLLKPVGKGICVVGSNRDGLLWHSSAIEKRLTSRKLLTSNGSVCRLKGHMDKLQAKEENIPDAIITKFHSGFPKEWQELIQEHFTSERSAVKEKTHQISKKGKKGKQAKNVPPMAEVKHNKYAKTHRKEQSSSLDKRKPLTRKVEPVNKSSGKAKTPAKMGDSSVLSDTSLSSEGLLDKTVLTPRGQVVSLDNLNRSRTGRILKPCVYWWAGQRVSVTDEGVVIKGTTEYGSKYLKTMEEDYKTKSKVFGRYRFSKLNDTSISSVSSESTVRSKSSDSSSLVTDKTSKNSLVKSKSRSVKVNNKIYSFIKESEVKSAESDTKKGSCKKQGKGASNKSSKKLDVSKSDLSEMDSNLPKSKKLKLQKVTPESAESDTKKGSCKKQGKGASNKTSKKLDVNKSDLSETDSNLPKSKKSKLKKAPTKDSDPKLDEEVIVLLNEVKENFLRNKAPNRTTCYNNTEKTSRTNKKSLKGSKDSYTLDESSDNAKAKTDKVIESKPVKTGRDTRVMERNKKKKHHDDPNPDSEANKVLKKNKTQDEANPDIEANKVLKKNKTQDEPNLDSETNQVVKKKKKQDKPNTDSETNPVLRNKEENGLTCLRDLVTSQCNLVNDKDSIATSVAVLSNRVTRSKSSQGVKVNYAAYFQTDRLVRPIKRTKLSTIKEADDSVNKSQNGKQTARNVNKSQNGKQTARKTKQASGKKKNLKFTEVEEQEKAGESRNVQEEETKTLLSIEKKTSSGKKTKNQQSKAGKLKEVALTAKSGTLKRKLQLKEVLEQQNENYEDNLFDSTPFRHTRKRKRAVLDDIDDNALFEELAKKQGKNKFVTPAAADVRSRMGRSVPLASARKTPACYSKEDLLGSTVKNLDGYVHNLKKRQLLHAKRRRKTCTPKSVKKSVDRDDSPQKKLFNEFLHAKKDTGDNHKDSDCEEDYYWDEETA